MLALVLACSISAGWVRAQTNTEYNFRHQSTVQGSSYGNPANSEDAPQLTMACLAANGYGQWTLSSLGGSTGSSGLYHAGWNLLANGLYTPCTHYDGTSYNPGCIPPGVVQSGSFSFPTPAQVKAVANLDGMVAFIWVQSGGAGFVQSGFTSTDVDLSLSFLSNPTPPMNVVSNTIHTATSIGPWPNISVGTKTITTSSGDWRDNFDVCADASFIYIVWGFIPTPGANEQIWVTAVTIGSGTAATGFPIMIPGSSDMCINPTITCDPRNNRGGGSSPAFDVAFINQTTSKIMVTSFSSGVLSTPAPLSQSFWDPGVGTPGQPDPWTIPMHARIIRNSIYGGTSSLAVYAIVNNGGLTHSLTDAWLIFYPPTNIFGTANFVAGDIAGVTTPVPITAPTPPVHDAPIIAFADPYDNQSGWHSIDEFHCLYQYDLWTTVPSSEEFPLCIVRGSDVAVAFPPQPDAPANVDTRLVLNQWTGTLENEPAGNYVAAVNQMGIHVHWLSDSVVGTVHYTVHNYCRDMNRTFDESIDENTLVTDQCYVTDGSSTGTNHGGTIGATVMTPSTFGAVTRITVWSDPNYGPPSEDGTFGLYSPLTLTTLSPYVGTLNFAGTTGTTNSSGTNVILEVGDDRLHGTDDGYYTGGTLTVMPNFLFNFVPTQGQGVTINYASTFDYYGLFATHNTSGVQTAIRTPFTDGSADNVGAGTIDLEGALGPGYYAYLSVHGGADFYISYNGTLISNTGSINVLHQASMYPTTSGMPNSPPVTGHMTLYGTTTLTSSLITGNSPALSSSIPGIDVIITSFGNFTASNCAFSNTLITGLSTIQFGDYPSYSFDPTSITSSSFYAANIHALNPTCYSSLDIGDNTSDGNTFDQIRNYGILVEQLTNDPALAPRPLTTIIGNSFYGFAPNAATIPPLTDEPTLYGIWFRNFAHIPVTDVTCNPEARPYLPWNSINIADNTFTQTGNYHSALVNNGTAANGLDMDFDVEPTSAAIELDNTTANVTSNTIEDNGYSVGIAVYGFPPIGYNVPLTSSLICSNTISGLTSGTSGGPNEELGMFTTNFQGYIQNNTITGCDNGYSSGGSGNGGKNTISHFICNTLSGNLHTTIDANDIATIDMSGIHSPHSTDIPLYNFAGFNTISGSPTYESTLSDPNNSANEFKLIHIHSNDGTGDQATINLSNSTEGWTWGFDGSGNPNYGRNNIIITPANTDSHGPTPYNQPFIVNDGNNSAPILSVDGNYFAVVTTLVNPSNGSTCTAIPACAGACYTPGPYNWPGYNLGINAYGITYCASPSATVAQSSLLSAPWANGCQDWVTKLATGTKKEGLIPLSEDSIADSCGFLLNYGNSLTQFQYWQDSYDTLQLFIDSCPLYTRSWTAFGGLDDDVQNFLNNNYSDDSTIYAKYRAWLYSVLYLNTTDPEYFCACVGEIFGSFGYATDDTTDQQRFMSGNMEVEFYQWALQNTDCDSGQELASWQEIRQQQLQLWQEDSIHGINYPYDTTIPTIPQIGYGLDTLLAKHAFYASVNETPQPSIISNATANPNPTGEGTVISFGISQEAYVKIELFDILGHEVGSAGFESLFEPGNKSVPLSLAGLPSGTYFARILTAYGEAQSVKLVKE